MWSLRLTDSQRDALRLLIQAQGEIGPSLTGALEALELARWDDLPDAALPWADVGRAGRGAGHRPRPTSCGTWPAACRCATSRRRPDARARSAGRRLAERLRAAPAFGTGSVPRTPS